VDAVVYLDGPSFFAVRRAFGGTLSSAASLAYVDAAIKTKQSPMILVNSEGRPWTPDGFRASWGKACKRAKIEGVTFSDLRGTAVTRLALVGCSESEIATITGHSIRDVRSILDAHYLHRDQALAERAWIAASFQLFILTTSNPFLRIADAALEGRDVNPILQDPGLAFHPPLLYLDYVGCSIAFSFAIAALLEGRIDGAWARWVRPWVLGAPGCVCRSGSPAVRTGPITSWAGAASGSGIRGTIGGVAAYAQMSLFDRGVTFWHYLVPVFPR
jgi:Cytochrome C assembly protein